VKFEETRGFKKCAHRLGIFLPFETTNPLTRSPDANSPGWQAIRASARSEADGQNPV
jgi:hypothetical protein